MVSVSWNILNLFKLKDVLKRSLHSFQWDTFADKIFHDPTVLQTDDEPNKMTEDDVLEVKVFTELHKY